MLRANALTIFDLGHVYLEPDVTARYMSLYEAVSLRG